MAAPFRPPCGGWQPTKIYDGGQFQHGRAGESSIPAWLNTTTVPDWRAPEDPEYSADGIEPYPHPALPASLPACAGDGAPCEVGQPACGPYAEPAVVNTFEEGPPLDKRKCVKLGWKAVQAFRQWHGRFGFLNNQFRGCNDLTITCHPEEAPDYDTSYSSELSAPDAEKFLTLTLTMHKEIINGAGFSGVAGATSTADLSWQITVGAQSGVKTRDSYSYSESIDPDTGTGEEGNPSFNTLDPFDPLINESAMRVEAAQFLSGDCRGTRDLLAAWNFSRDISGVGTGTNVSVLTATNTLIELAYDFEPAGASAAANPEVHVTFSVELSNSHPWSDVYADMVALAALWDLSDDLLLPWRQDLHHTIAPLVTRREPREDVDPQSAEGDIMLGGAYTDVNAAIYDGSIVGAPELDGLGHPFYGRDRYFDSRHENWNHCEDGTWYIETEGAFNPEYLPGTVTQWTNRFDAEQRLYPGAFVGRVYQDTPLGIAWGSGVWLQKYAETKIPLPSQNFFNPAGARRFDMDEVRSWCVTDISGSAITLDNTFGVGPADFGARFILCDTGDLGLDGVYPITAGVDQWHVTLGTKIWDLPDGYTAAPPGASFAPTPKLGQVRWPDAWPIQGRIPVVAATQNGADVDIILLTPATYLRSGDSVDFTGVGSLGSDLAVTVTDSLHVTVTGTVGVYTDLGYVKSHGAPNYYWSVEELGNAESKGDFLVFTWLKNYRDYAERDRVNAAYADCPTSCVGGDCSAIAPADGTVIRPNQLANGIPREVEQFSVQEDCLEFSPCSPSVIFITPNGETSANSRTYDFPAASDVVPDYFYGGKQWHCVPKQSDRDLYWQAPHIPCADDETVPAIVALWREDVGICAEDSVDPDLPGRLIYYYPAPPLVEARASLPANGGDGQDETAPDLPAGLFLNYLTLTELNASVPPGVDGNVAPPPDRGSTLSSPFVFYFSAQFCITFDGRFAELYEGYF